MCHCEQVVVRFLGLVRVHGGVGEYALFYLIFAALAYNILFGLLFSGVAVIPHSVYSQSGPDNDNYTTCKKTNSSEINSYSVNLTNYYN